MLRRARTGLLLVGAITLAACSSTSPDVRAVPNSTGGVVVSGTAGPPETPASTPGQTPGASPTPTTGTAGVTSSAPAAGSDPSTDTADPAGATCSSIPLPTAPPSTTVAPEPIDVTGDGVGDPLFPDLGNPGIDVQHYDVTLDYDHGSKALSGVVTATISFSADMTAFNLDAAESVDATAVTVDAVTATVTHDKSELRITPKTPVAIGSTHTVAVTFTTSTAGRNVEGLLPGGWFDTDLGSYNLNEPDGGRLWLPSNDYPSDKATWKFSVSVPVGVTAIANGALLGHESSSGRTTWIWEEKRPMSSYLVQVVTGPYDLVDGTGPHGLPLLSAVLTKDRSTMQPYLDGISDEIAYFEQFFGPYPLDRYGIAVTDSASGLAMEEQERSLFSRFDLRGTLGLGEQLVLSHELAHQWFGDAVSPARWQDVWLNEGFATYGQWMWLDHIGLQPLSRSVDQALHEQRQVSPAAPTVEAMFGNDVYDGGALVLQALRRQIGDATFFTVLRQWVAKYNGTSRTTEDFIGLAEQVSGQDLTTFFDDWLFSTTLPKALPC